jgi:serine/threonine-protein kinase
MSTPTPTELLAFLQEHQFLTPSQWQQIGGSLAKSADSQALVRELVERKLLTTFQANLLLQGRGKNLLFGPYRLLERLGEGGMGQVFKALHINMDRLVALKIIPKELVSNPLAVSRFYREARAVAKLSHPNIVTAFDVNSVGQTHYLAMELVDGIDLARLVQQSGPLAVTQACDYIRQAAVGLQHANENGLVHRDIKPGNLMVARSRSDGPPIIKILDFGLARFESDRDHTTRLTQLGQIVGTVDYIAPEQSQNARMVNIRADIYSLGCSLFYLLTGNPPFPGDDAAEKISARVLGDVPSVRKSRPEVSADLDRIIAKMTARHPKDRYQMPAEVAEVLEPYTVTEKQALSRPTGVSERIVAQPEHSQAASQVSSETLSSQPIIRLFDTSKPVPARGLLKGLLIVAVVFVLVCLALGILFFRVSSSKLTTGIQLAEGKAQSKLASENNPVSESETLSNPGTVKGVESEPRPDVSPVKPSIESEQIEPQNRKNEEEKDKPANSAEPQKYPNANPKTERVPKEKSGTKLDIDASGGKPDPVQLKKNEAATKEETAKKNEVATKAELDKKDGATKKNDTDKRSETKLPSPPANPTEPKNHPMTNSKAAPVPNEKPQTKPDINASRGKPDPTPPKKNEIAKKVEPAKKNEEPNNKESAKKAESKKRASLSDRIPEGTVLTGTYLFNLPDGEGGSAKLTITERKGNKVKGRYVPKKAGAAEAYGGWDFEGAIVRNELSVKTVGEATRALRATLNGNTLRGTVFLFNTGGTVTASVTFTLDK